MFENLIFQISSSNSPPLPITHSILFSFIPTIIFSLLAIWIFTDSKLKTYPHGKKFVAISLISIIPIILMIHSNFILFFTAIILMLILPFIIAGIYQKFSDYHLKLLWHAKFTYKKRDSKTHSNTSEKSEKVPTLDLPLSSLPPRLNIHLLPFALSTTFKICDEFDRVFARISRKTFALNPTFVIYDTHGRELGSIVGRLFSIRPTYDIFYTHIGYLATVKKKLISIFPQYSIEKPVDTTIFRCFGDFFSFEFKILDRNSHLVATVSRVFPSPFRTYNLMLISDADPSQEPSQNPTNPTKDPSLLPSLLIPLIIVIAAQTPTKRRHR